MMKQVKFQNAIRTATLSAGLFLSASAFAQQITVKGHVVDETGEPVIGASVKVVGGKAGAVTDIDGNFSIAADKKATLEITYIGYEPLKVVAGQDLKIQLKNTSTTLNDVVVIGYGRAKKNDLTGSVTAIKPDEMSKGITSSASDMLVGKIAGVDVQTAGGQPGAGAQIRIRGGASLSASNDPLYVIDGLAIDNNNLEGTSNVLAMINPNDIESFTVLKDASATAIYGSRASNGVIIITTKKGRAGQRPTVTYNGDITISTIQKKYEVMNASEYKQALTSLGKNTSGLGDADTDWQDEIFRTSVSTKHSLSIQGGLQDMPYRIGLGFEDNNGIVKTSWMKRFNTSVNLAPSFLDKHLNFNFTAKYMFEKDRYADHSSAIFNALRMDPTQPVRTDDEMYNCVGGYFQYLQAKDSKITDPNWTNIAASQVPQNPVALLNNQKIIAKTHDISSNLEVDYKIHGFEDLHLHAAIGAQYTDAKQQNDISKYSFSNNYFGLYGTKHSYKYSVEGKAFAEYAHKFGAHDIDIMAGAEQSHFHRTWYDHDVGSGIDEYLRDNNPLYETTEGKWNYEHDPKFLSDEMRKSHNSLLSYFGRFNYNLLDRYLLTATFRADGSSRFRKGKKWGYFPAAAFAWKINNEPFMKNVKWIDELKLRLGWGMTGQQNGIDDFYYTTQYRVSNSYAQYPFGDKYYQTLRPSASNPDLTWEKTTTYNAGLDFTALNGRFGVNVDGYYRKTTDLLASVAIAGGTNFGDQLLQNIGSLENYGVELAFNVKPIVTKDFVWDVTYNVGWNHNEITELEAGQQDWVWTGEPVSRSNDAKVQANKVGKPINSFYVFQQVYDENGKPIEGLYVDRNGDGKIDVGDRYCYKSPAPDVIMGLTTKFIYKNWDFSAAFHASIGNYVYYDFLNSKANLAEITENNAYVNTTTEAVNLGFTGKTSNPNIPSDYFVRNASYLKCTNMTLGYSFPALIKAGAEKICSGRIFFTVQNPFIITKYDGIDPEVSSGMDKNPYPRPISFQLGLNLNF